MQDAPHQSSPSNLERIPGSLRPFFQDCDFDTIDPDVDAFTVIERTLAWGNRAELAWLFRRFAGDEIVEFVSSAGWWRLPRHRFYYWLNILALETYERSTYEPIWPH